MILHRGDAYRAPHSGACDFRDGLLDFEVHIVEAGGACRSHFPDGNLAAATDILRAKFVFEGPDVAGEPFLQFHIVCVAAKQGHCGVGVGVEKRWQDGEAVRLDAFVARGVIRHTDGLEALILNEDVSLD